MRRTRYLHPIFVAIPLLSLAMVVQLSGFVAAEMASGPSLVISQLKITSSNGQFITLYNATNTTLDMGKYQLEYFNSYDLGKATSSRLIPLSGALPPHGYYVVSDDTLPICFKVTISSLSLGFSSTAGLVQVLQYSQSSPGSLVTPTVQDYVGWSKAAVSHAQTLPASTESFLQREPRDSSFNPVIMLPGSGSWQQVRRDSNNLCSLVSVITQEPVAPPAWNQLLPETEAPATILQAADDGQPSTPVMPPGNIGLKAPSVTELLPNPTGTGTDDTDEFIELYNPNPKPFDLTGFSLQTGLTTLRTYAFPVGTMLPPMSFKAFSSADTDIALSNSGGQVKLLDPFGSSISATAPYGTAKDGIAWASAKHKWYWTTTTTPNTSNVVREPAKKKTATKVTAKKTTAKVAATSTPVKASSVASAHAEEEPAIFPVHTKTLALVVGLALLYGAYEYRTDAANRIHQLRRHLGIRRRSRR